MTGFFEVTLGGLLGSGIAATVAGALFLRRNKTLESEIKAHFDERLRVFESTRRWKETALSQLFGPMVMQFERTGRAFARWSRRNLYLEAAVIREGNRTVRDLLLEKGHLIPPHLMADGVALVEHYDRWLEAFESKRGAESPENDDAFVFVGPEGFPFPREAEERMKAEFERLQKDLYGLDRDDG